jgi:hypothetical protein
MLGRFILVFIVLVSALYSESCYSVNLIDVKKKNIHKLKKNFNVPPECIIAKIGKYGSVRCGCTKTYKQAKHLLDTKYTQYDGAFVRQTRKSRFKKHTTSKDISIPVKKTIVKKKKVQALKKSTIVIPRNATFSYVKIDQESGKLVDIHKRKKKETISTKKRVSTLNARVNKILKKKSSSTEKTKKVVHTTKYKQKPIKVKKSNTHVKKAASKKITSKKDIYTPMKITKPFIMQPKKEPIKDEAIRNKLNLLKHKLKVLPKKKEDDFVIIEPQKITPIKKKHPKKSKHSTKKKYFHEEDKDIAEILNFIDSDDDLDDIIEDKPLIDKEDEDFFNDDFDEKNDLFFDD